MARCEDFPCCGHELGCCPDFDESGRQLNMVCTCGAKVPLTSRYSICEGCLARSLEAEDGNYDGDFCDESFDEDEMNEQLIGDEDHGYQED